MFSKKITMLTFKFDMHFVKVIGYRLVLNKAQVIVPKAKSI